VGAAVLGLIAAGCAPAPSPPTIAVYGDSLILQSSAHLTARLHAQLPGWNVVVRSAGGTSQCDWHSWMRSDANTYNVRAVVVSFSGNNLSPCSALRAYPGSYSTDATWAVDFWAVQHHVPVMFTAAPGEVGTTPTGRLVPNIYVRVGATRGEYVADPTPLFLDPASGRYAAKMPCLRGECTGTIRVRALDGAHLCVDPFPALVACSGYSSGVVRFVDSIIHGVAVVTHTAPPAPRRLLSPTSTTTTTTTTPGAGWRRAYRTQRAVFPWRPRQDSNLRHTV
jgi:hypothetical protein